jgi:rhodanese-related sulfurtransferase
MKTKILGFGLIFLLIINGILYSNSKNNVLELLYSPAQLEELLNNVYPSNVMIDLRDRIDYEEGHIDGFINIPSEDGLAVDQYLQDRNLTRKYVYIMCYTGHRAAKTAEYLKSKKYMHVVYITFGYDEYAYACSGFIPKVGSCECLAN